MRAARALLAVFLLLSVASEAAAGRKPGKVRKAAVAGSYYSLSRAGLTASTFGLLRQGSGEATPSEPPLALVVPHAGWPFSGAVAAAAYRMLRPGDFDRVVVVGPAHDERLGGFALDDSRAHATPLGEVTLCTGVAASLAGEDAHVRREIGRREHSIEVQLPFLQVALGSFCLVPVLVGETDAGSEKRFASRLEKLKDGRTLFVFSSDLTHWGARYAFTPFASRLAEARPRIRDLDERAVALLESGDASAFRGFLKETRANICGKSVLSTLLELLDILPPAPRLHRLATWASADLPRVEEEVSVGYAALGAWSGPPPASAPLATPPPPLRQETAPPELDQALGLRLVRLARATLETELFGTNALLRELRSSAQGEANERSRGVFVTLTRRDPRDAAAEGALRGCQGQIVPVLPVDLAVVQATLDAAFHDPRFSRLTPLEFQRVDLSVSVLSLPRAVTSWQEIRLGHHGIVLQKGKKAALFLPEVPEQEGWNLETTLDNLARKARLDRRAWRDGAHLFVFTGQAFGEGPAARR